MKLNTQNWFERRASFSNESPLPWLLRSAVQFLLHFAQEQATVGGSLARLVPRSGRASLLPVCCCSCCWLQARRRQRRGLSFVSKMTGDKGIIAEAVAGIAADGAAKRPHTSRRRAQTAERQPASQKQLCAGRGARALLRAPSRARCLARRL